jgi:hypothetical protein
VLLEEDAATVTELLLVSEGLEIVVGSHVGEQAHEFAVDAAPRGSFECLLTINE